MRDVSIIVHLVHRSGYSEFVITVYNDATYEEDTHTVRRTYTMTVSGEAYTAANEFFKKLDLPGEMVLAPAGRDKWVGVAI